MHTHRPVSRKLLRATGAGLLVSLILWSAAAEAIVFSLANRASPRISIRVGGGGNNISEIQFTVPAAQIGNGTAVAGSPTIRIDLVVPEGTTAEVEIGGKTTTLSAGRNSLGGE